MTALHRAIELRQTGYTVWSCTMLGTGYSRQLDALTFLERSHVQSISGHEIILANIDIMDIAATDRRSLGVGELFWVAIEGHLFQVGRHIEGCGATSDEVDEVERECATAAQACRSKDN